MSKLKTNTTLVMLGVLLGIILTGLTDNPIQNLWRPQSQPTAAVKTNKIISPAIDHSNSVWGEETFTYITYADLVNQEIQATDNLRAQITPDHEPPPLLAASPPPSDNNTYQKIVFFGDSMVKTMGSFDYLKSSLKEAGIIAEVQNLAVSSQNISDALPNILSYQGKPDLIIIESYAYNPMAGDLNIALGLQRDLLTQAITTLRHHTGAKIYLLLTIAPNSTVFGEGENGVNWNQQRRQDQVKTIMAYLNNAYALAQNNHYPLINCFSRSLDGGQGKIAYINPADGIHPSRKGQQFISQQIVNTIKNDILTTYAPSL